MKIPISILCRISLNHGTNPNIILGRIHGIMAPNPISTLCRIHGIMAPNPCAGFHGIMAPNPISTPVQDFMESWHQILCRFHGIMAPKSNTTPAEFHKIRAPNPCAVANARIDAAGNGAELNSRLRYSCNPGYKRKAGTSSLIQCILWNGSEPRWTDPTLQCIRKTSPGIWERGHLRLRRMGRDVGTPQFLFLPKEAAVGTTGVSSNSSPSPAPGQSPVPPAHDGLSPDRSRPPEPFPTSDTSLAGEGTTIAPTDYAAGWDNSRGNPALHQQRLFHFSSGIFSFSPTSFPVSLLSASPPFLPLQLKISFSLFFSSFRPVYGLFRR
uniref:Sushi domain-containing protein n=1 Tax=Malurus cyaneus samueli TaxID=2593467 RepID=A0A8C5TRY6_9PASS